MSTRINLQPASHDASHEIGGSDVVRTCGVATSATASPVTGDIYYNAATNKLMLYETGAGWGSIVVSQE